MSITTSVPSNLRRPGAFHEFVAGLAGGLVALDTRVVIVAIKSSAGTATAATPVQIFDESDADTKLGKGSEAALMARVAFAQARKSRSQPQIWACPMAAPSGAAAVQTITTTVTTALAGNVVIRIAGRTIVVGVSAGDAQNTIAAAIEKAIDAEAAAGNLPVTASVSTNVVTCTHVTHGVNGNDVDYEIVSTPSGVSVATTQTVAGSAAVDITAALSALMGADYDAIAIANHTSTDTADALANSEEAWGPEMKRWRHIFIGETGSVSTANGLADDCDDRGVLVISCENSPSLPGELAVACAVAAVGKSRPNANLNDEELVIYPPPAASAYTNAEIETLLAGGSTPLVPTSDGTATKIVRLVTTQITLNSAPYDGLRDWAQSRTHAFIARQLDIAWAQKFRQELLDDEVMARARDMVIEIHEAAQSARILRDVDEFKDQILVEESELTPGRIVLVNPFRVAGPLHQAVFLHTHYL